MGGNLFVKIFFITKPQKSPPRKQNESDDEDRRQELKEREVRLKRWGDLNLVSDEEEELKPFLMQ